MDHSNDMSFWEHLDEFRNRLLIVLGSFILGALTGYSYSEDIIQLLILPSDKLNISFCKIF